MSLISYKRGQGSIVIRCKILNSSLTTGGGLTGLTSASSGLRIATIADNEASATAYTVAGSTIETITTLGTYAAPTATKCRFKEVDSTNHPGVYELQIADARFAVSSAKSLLVSVSGATNAAETDFVVPLTDVDPYDSVRGGQTALPNAAAGANGGLPVLSSSATTLAYTISTLTTYTGNTPQTGDSYARIGSAGAGLTSLGDTRIANLDATVSSRGTSTLTQTQVTGGAYSVQSASCVLGDARVANLDATVSSRGTSTLTQAQVTGGAYTIQSSSCVLGDGRIANLDAAVSTRMATYTQPTGFLAATFPAIVASTTNISAGTITTTTNLTNLPTMPTDWVTAAGLKADAVSEIQSGLMLAASYTAPPSAATISTQVASDLAAAHGAGSWATATGFATSSALSAVEAKIDAINTIVDSIVADTNELQADWANGGRLDLILDARASQSSVDGLNNIAATDIVSNGPISTSNGSIFNVLNTENTGMVGFQEIFITAGRFWVINEEGNPLASASALQAVSNNIDDIKTTTDQFRFTVPNQVDSNSLTGGGGSAPTVEQIAAGLFVDGAANKLKVNADHSVPAGVTLSPDDISGIADAVSDEIAGDIPTVEDIVSGLSGRSIRVDSPFAAGGSLTIFSGDDYCVANGKSLRSTITNRTDLIGMTPVMYLESVVTLALTAPDVESGTETLVFEDLFSADTVRLWDGIGNAPAVRKYQIKFINPSGNITTQIDGVLHVRRGLNSE